MSLGAGTKLGPYEILARIGAGGMGEVYRARDARLDRIVAIKVSKERFSERFEREARSIAALNHPHICTLHDVGPDYLVMEYIEGAPLKGPMSVEQVTRYAAQICDALDAAHKKGITHRDLKPANILVTKSGVKLLDFGLARVASGGADDTVTMAVTGTPAYMSPEQWEGKSGDARSDIYALGCVLYEMATGKRIPQQDRQMLEPPALESVVETCLKKEPDERWQSARDVRHALEMPTAAPAARGSRPFAWIATAAVSALIAVAALTMWWRQSVPEPRAIHFQVSAPAGAEFPGGIGGGGSAISPDGRTLAFVAVLSGVNRLWVRPLDSVNARELPGTEGVDFPFWSPDGRSLGFFAGGKLKRIEVAGGPPVVLADAVARGGAWGTDGTILFTPNYASGLQRVKSSGGGAVTVTKLDAKGEESNHRWPQFLPGGKQFLYYTQSVDPATSGVYLGSVERPDEKTRLVGSQSNGLYAPPLPGHPGSLLWLRESTLMAQPFDATRARLYGEAIAVPGAETVSFSASINAAFFSVSNQGAIAFRGGDDRDQLTWFSREGKPEGTVGKPERHGSLRISPDGKSVATSVRASSGVADIWRIDLARGVPSRLTFDGRGYAAAWSPDGQRIDYGAINRTLSETAANGVGSARTILQSSHNVFISDWSPDGRYLMYQEQSPEALGDLWLLPASGDRKPIPYLKTPFHEVNGQFSPDGKWVSYTSNESGRVEVYVQSFPAGGAKFTVSTNGGDLARWRPDQRELFYRALDGKLMGVSVRPAGQGLEFGTPVALMSVQPPTGAIAAYPYDIGRDGRILALAPVAGEAASPLTVIMNWQTTLKK
jgi:Tol biopolymer transport system component/predicted Ser/Thr protein kinase